METFKQPKITGYRQLSEAEAALMNEAKEIAEQCGAFVEKLRAMPATGKDGVPIVVDGQPSIDQRWVSIGATQLQQGWMAVIRSIAQPSTF
jgi:hypothetical protein